MLEYKRAPDERARGVGQIPLVWITKYRCKVLRGEVTEQARDLIRQICQVREVSIVRGLSRKITGHLTRVREDAVALARQPCFSRQKKEPNNEKACGSGPSSSHLRYIAVLSNDHRLTTSSRAGFTATPILNGYAGPNWDDFQARGIYETSLKLMVRTGFDCQSDDQRWMLVASIMAELISTH